MINYKSFKLPGNGKLRVRTENIVATVSTKQRNVIDLYVAGLANPFHITIEDNEAPKEYMDYIWERTSNDDRGED